MTRPPASGVRSQEEDPTRTLYRTRRPGPPLADFVELLWFHEADAPAHARERVLPTGAVDLVFNLREDRFRLPDTADVSRCQDLPGSLIGGPHARFFVIDTAQHSSVMGVHFKPGGAGPFLRLPLDALRDQHVALETLWGARARALRDSLAEAGTPDQKLLRLETALLAELAGRRPTHLVIEHAVRKLRQAPTVSRIATLADDIGMSHRHFARVFAEEVGLTPKVFGRIGRFQHALRLVERGLPVDWVDVALACGYFDQAHLVHDFQAFCGLNPTTYLARRTEHHNHVALAD